MQIGLLMIGDAPVRVMVERARLAETVGYDTVWLADERFYREVYSCLTHFAACTSKVLLGPCLTDPFSRHPALTAMAIATLDEISNQRAILGIGAGISGFTELGINRRKPARAIREMIEVIGTLLRGEGVDFHGGRRVPSGALEFRAKPIFCSNLRREQSSLGPTRRRSDRRRRHYGGLRHCLRSRSLLRAGYRRCRSSRA
jgi:alkanesulfonate monooxygenase SsuD/methylene tetrahydromethanopterin reductase-like flavin-dependent oxidoreductase (luciferase family)